MLKYSQIVNGNGEENNRVTLSFVIHSVCEKRGET